MKEFMNKSGSRLNQAFAKSVLSLDWQALTLQNF